MAAKIKLTRMGAKKQPTYRVVIQEEHSKRDGRFIEIIGFYNPRTDPATIVLNQERMNYWLGVGARPTDSVGQLLRTAGITDKYYHYKTAKTQPVQAEAAETATPPAEAVAA
ncbi:MAG: 30S ribosomal protein S16 [Anaerolineae bacterium]